MGGGRTPGPTRSDPAAENAQPIQGGSGTLASPGPVGIDAEEPDILDNVTRIYKVTKDWKDPPVVTPGVFREISGKTLKEVLAWLSSLIEWGEGGGDISGDEMQPDDKNRYTAVLKGTFFVRLPKWTEYNQATQPQKNAWDAMITDLEKHEREHVAIAYRGAEKLVRKLCGLDVTLASQAMEDSRKATQADQDDFDSKAKTDHAAKDYLTFKRVYLDTTADPPPSKP